MLPVVLSPVGDKGTNAPGELVVSFAFGDDVFDTMEGVLDNISTGVIVGCVDGSVSRSPKALGKEVGKASGTGGSRKASGTGGSDGSPLDGVKIGEGVGIPSAVGDLPIILIEGRSVGCRGASVGSGRLSSEDKSWPTPNCDCNDR